MEFERFKILETKNPKLRLIEIQQAVNEPPIIVTFEAFLTKELIEWLKSQDIDLNYIDRLERILNVNQPIR